MPNGTVITKGADGFKIREKRRDEQNNVITINYSYKRNKRGDVVTDQFGNAEQMVMESEDRQYETISGNMKL